jgi:hypothetical protein
MKLFDYYYYNDYGAEHYIQILQAYPKFALIDCVIQWDDYPATEIFPLILFSIGSRSVCGFSIRWKWFQIRFDLLTSTPRNLEYYRRNKDD